MINDTLEQRMQTQTQVLPARPRRSGDPALDSLTGEQVMDSLTTAARDHGTTVVLVTHEPRVAAYADREVVVRDGKVMSLLPTAAAP